MMAAASYWTASTDFTTITPSHLTLAGPLWIIHWADLTLPPQFIFHCSHVRATSTPRREYVLVGRRLRHRVPEYSRPCCHSSKPCVMWLKCCLCEYHQHWQLSAGQLSDAAIITKLFTAVGSMQTTRVEEKKSNQTVWKKTLMIRWPELWPSSHFYWKRHCRKFWQPLLA